MAHPQTKLIGKQETWWVSRLGRWREVSLDITDSKPEPLKIDMPVEMTFLRRYADKGHGIPGYFGKVEPESA